MAQVRFTNVGKTTLNGAITDVATSIVVNDGSVFPSLSGGDWFYLTLEDTSLNREVVKVTARSTNTLTVTRAQDGTTARAFSNADKAEIRVCAALLTDLVSAAYILSALVTVDGSGSGLDADTLDGYNIGTSGSAIPLLSGSNTWTTDQTFGGITTFSRTSPDVRFYESDAAADTKYWSLIIDAGILAFRLVNDAYSAVTSVYTISRTGYATPTWTFGSTVVLTHNGNTIWHAGNDGSGSGLDADLLDGLSSAAFAQLASAAAFTAAVTVSVGGGTLPLRVTNTQDNANVQALIIEGDRATPAAADIVYMSFYLSDSGGSQEEFARISAVASTVTNLSEAGYLMFSARASGTVTNAMRMTTTALSPHTSDGMTLGTTSNMWGDLFLASGGVINFNNGDVTVTHGTDTLAFAGAASGYTFDAALSVTGTTGRAFYARQWADFSDNYTGYAVLGSNLYSRPDTSIYITPNTHASVGYAALRLITNNIQFAGVSGATTAGATVTPTWNTVWHAGNDGSGSGLDADLLDGNNIGTSGAAVPLLNGVNTWSNAQTFSSTITINAANPIFQFYESDAAVDTKYWEHNINAGVYTLRILNDAYAASSSIFTITRSTHASATFNFASTVTLQYNSNTIWHAGNDGAGSGLDADLLDGLSSAAFAQLSGASFTGQVLATVAGTGLRSINTNDAVSNQALRLESDRATPAAGDLVFMSFYVSDSVGTQTEMARISGVGSTVTDASETGYLAFGATTTGTLANVMRMTGAALSPHVSDGLALGTTALMWADLFLASGGVINFNNGDVTITHSANTLAFAGAATGYTFDGNVTSTTTGTGAPLTLTSTDAGASAFTFDIYRNSASPAASDAIAAIRFRGQNSTPAAFTYASIQANIADPTAASEDSILYLATTVAGAAVNALTLSISATTHKFNSPTDCIVTSVGNSGYGSFYPQGSGTNNSYLFMGNATSGERCRITATDARLWTVSNDGGVTAHLSVSSAGVITASGSTVWHAGNDGAGSGLDADLLDGKNIGTSGSAIPLLDGTNTWSGTQTMSALTARVTLTTAVSGTLTSAHANVSLELNGDVTLPNSVFTAGDKTVFDPGTSARTFTRGAGIAMYVNGVDSASATLAANQMGGAHWRSASVVVLSGGFT